MELDGLYQEYAKMIYHFIYLKCNDKELAEDIVQTTFLKAIMRIDSFHGECKISTWLCQIARNEYLNYCRKHNRQQSYDMYLENNPELPAGQETCFHDAMLEKMIRDEQTDSIRKLLQSLKEPYREVFMLRVYGEYSFDEIAVAFHRSDTWARVTYYRAKEKIKEGLERMGGAI